ncbi:MAG: DUF4297 domain-containing protein [Clostridiales bacterium]|nr:DUF4297 domain-containing protein [Clostridiales bacterium]
MRQADSTIKGYLYQFNKSIYEILQSKDDEIVTLEGVIEDIDIQSPTSLTTIQCKYHEDKKYQISSVVAPILEMLCHYCECSVLGKSVSYILYAYYEENVDTVSLKSFSDFLESTNDKEILVKYFHRIYTIADSEILKIANKPQKSKDDKDKILAYYKINRNKLVLRTDILEFWKCFTYIPAEQFDALQEKIIQSFAELVSVDTAEALYYPNAFSLVATISAKPNKDDRNITKVELLDYLSTQKSVLLTKWTLEALDRVKLLRSKRDFLKAYFSSNSSVRAFVFSDDFLEKNQGTIFPFIIQYLDKYFKKRKLQKQPIFIFGDGSSALLQTVLISLYKYQRSVNTGLIGNEFIADSFICDTYCAADFACKMTQIQNISSEILEKCRVNQLYIIGENGYSLESSNYSIEYLDVADTATLKYLVWLSMRLEE